MPKEKTSLPVKKKGQNRDAVFTASEEFKKRKSDADSLKQMTQERDNVEMQEASVNEEEMVAAFIDCQPTASFQNPIANLSCNSDAVTEKDPAQNNDDNFVSNLQEHTNIHKRAKTTRATTLPNYKLKTDNVASITSKDLSKVEEDIGTLEFKKLHEKVVEDSSNEEDGVNVFIDNKPSRSFSNPLASFDVSSDSNSDGSDEDDVTNKKAAWVDENDTLFTTQEVLDIQGRKINLGSKAAGDYKQCVEERFKSIMGVPKWAKRRKKDKFDLLTSTGNLVKAQKSLKKGTIELQMVQDLNCQTYLEGNIIKSVLFHPTSTVGLVAGTNGIVSLFQVDGRDNTKLQSIKFRRFPISCAAFSKNGEEFMIGSWENKYFYAHDLISGTSQPIRNLTFDITNVKNLHVTPDGKMIAIFGRFGAIHLLSTTTKEHISTLRMNGDVTSLAFHKDKMFSHGVEGEVYVWDLNSRQCVHKFVDDGCITGSSIATSPNGMLLATGSSSGVVNIYDMVSACSVKTPSPMKSVFNLVTEVNSMKFNPTSEILSFASSHKVNSMKMLHCPSMSVFSNFPIFTARFNRVQCLDFSPNSGYFAFGDNRKIAHLIRLKHYGNY